MVMATGPGPRLVVLRRKTCPLLLQLLTSRLRTLLLRLPHHYPLVQDQLGQVPLWDQAHWRRLRERDRAIMGATRLASASAREDPTRVPVAVTVEVTRALSYLTDNRIYPLLMRIHPPRTVMDENHPSGSVDRLLRQRRWPTRPGQGHWGHSHGLHLLHPQCPLRSPTANRCLLSTTRSVKHSVAMVAWGPHLHLHWPSPVHRNDSSRLYLVQSRQYRCRL